jgi:REP element-mobilizing transposase RayT
MNNGEPRQTCGDLPIQDGNIVGNGRDRSLHHTRKKMRLAGYDYTTPGAYFVTICVKGKRNSLGSIVASDGSVCPKIALNDYGKIVETQWKWLFGNYKHISMDEYVIMPDHFHGIILIVGNGRDRSQHVKPLPQIIGAFKTTSSKFIHSAGGLSFQWQKSYYDRIIRDEREMQNIRQYVRNNPLRTHLDHEPESALRDFHG